jgi:hypothetical protein
MISSNLHFDSLDPSPQVKLTMDTAKSFKGQILNQAKVIVLIQNHKTTSLSFMLSLIT